MSDIQKVSKSCSQINPHPPSSVRSVLELIEPKQRTALARKLRKQGIFLEVAAA
jgi:hypothetical protein